ncbi:MAG: presqualene diphosphate synthase HpnD [Ignavibacteriales bacterium]|nr:presqualene diphosphate synthase HpnD [Ignavibacteriales bacterium]
MDSLLTLDNLEKNKRSNFYYSFLLLPKPKREAINIVYAWCRYADDIVDEEENVNRKYVRLRQWSREFESAIEGTSRYPLLNRLSQIIQRFHIPLHHFRDLLRGMEMDLVKTRYASFGELREYCYYAASTVGLICTEIFGYKHEGAKEYAVNLGIALQLVNILRDVQSDAEHDRIYLPQEDLERFGYSEEDIRNGVYDQRFINLMEFECDRARGYFDTAIKHLSEEDKPLFIAALIMQAIYFRILMDIKHRRYNVYGKRIRLTAFRKIMIALNVWWKNHPTQHHDS